MSLDKAIEHGKEHREPYRKSRRFDSSCRNHGNCPWCSRNRQIQKKRESVEVEQAMKEVEE